MSRIIKSSSLVVVMVLLAASPAWPQGAQERFEDAWKRDDSAAWAEASYEALSESLARYASAADPRERLLAETAALWLLHAEEDAVGTFADRRRALQRMPALRGRTRGVASLRMPFDEQLARLLEHLEGPRRADDTRLTMGVVTDWLLIDGFDNERGVGFDTAYPPEEGFDPSAEYQGKRRMTRWRALKMPAPRPSLNMAAICNPAEQTLAYLTVFLHSSVLTRVRLSLATTGAYKAWLNGRPLLALDIKHRELAVEHESVVFTLLPGWNQLLLKTAVEEGPWNVSARLGEPDHREPLVNVTIKAALEAFPAPPEGAVKVESADQALYQRLERAVAQDPFDAELALRFLLAYDRHSPYEHDDHRLLRLAERLAASQPDNPWAHYALARALDTKSAIEAERDDNHRRAALKRVLELDPRFHRARLELYDLDAALSLNERLGEHLDAFGEDEPRSFEARVRRMDWLSQRGQEETSQRVFVAVTEDFPKSPVLLQRWERYWTGLGDHDESDRAFQAMYQQARGEVALQLRFAERQARLSGEEAFQVEMRRARALDPFNKAGYQREADYHAVNYDLAGLQRAIAALEEWLVLAPGDAEALAQLGHWHYALGDDQSVSRADQYWSRSLMVDPNQPRLKRYLDAIALQRPKFEKAFEEDFSELKARSAAVKTEPNDRYLQVLERRIVRLNRDGTYEGFLHNISRIVSEAGVREMTSIGVPGGRGEDLKIEDAKLYRGDEVLECSAGGGWFGASVRPPPLRIGDLIEVKARLNNGQRSYFGDYYDETVVFGGDVPYLRQDFILICPKSREFAVHSRNGASPPTITETAEEKVYRFTLENIAKIKPEPLMPGWDEVLPTVEVSSYQSWDEFSRWYYNLVKNQLDPTPEIEAKVHELTDHLESEYEKVQAIYNFVVTDIRYEAWEFGVHGYKPYKAGTIYNRKFGDCKDKAILINAMLKVIGVKGDMVLIRGEMQRPDEDLTLPMIGHFNHCIARVTFGDGRQLFLDGTAQYHGMEELPDMDKGAKVLIVGKDRGVIETIPYPDGGNNRTEDEYEVRLDAERAEVAVTASTRAFGTACGELRQAFDIEQRRALLLERRFATQYGGSQVSQVTVSDLKNLNLPVEIGYQVTIPRFVTRHGDRLEFRPVLFPSDFTRYVTLDERSHDWVFIAPKAAKDRARYLLPDGYDIDHSPEDFTASTDFLECSLSFRREAGVLTMERRLVFKAPRVDAGQYLELRRILVDLDAREKEVVTLKRRNP